MENANPQARNSAQLIPFFLFEGAFPRSRNDIKLLQIPSTITYLRGNNIGGLAQFFILFLEPSQLLGLCVGKKG